MPATNHIARERVKNIRNENFFLQNIIFEYDHSVCPFVLVLFFGIPDPFGELWIHHKRYSTIISKITFFRYKRSKDFPTNRPDCENEIYPEAKSISLVFIENSKHRIQFRKTNKNHTHTHTLKREKEVSKNKHVNS